MLASCYAYYKGNRIAKNISNIVITLMKDLCIIRNVIFISCLEFLFDPDRKPGCVSHSVTKSATALFFNITATGMDVQ